MTWIVTSAYVARRKPGASRVCTVSHGVAYHLDCQDCGFESYVEEDHWTLLDEVDTHHDEHGDSHFVEFELIENGESA